MSLGILSGKTLGALVANEECKTFQARLNSILVPQGFQAIATDGKCGASTCGAAAEAAKTVPGIRQEFGFDLPGVCPSSTPPRKGSSGGGFAPPLTPPIETSSAGMLGMDQNTLLLVAAVAVGAYVFLGPKKKKAAA